MREPSEETAEAALGDDSSRHGDGASALLSHLRSTLDQFERRQERAHHRPRDRPRHRGRAQTRRETVSSAHGLQGYSFSNKMKARVIRPRLQTRPDRRRGDARVEAANAASRVNLSRRARRRVRARALGGVFLQKHLHSVERVSRERARGAGDDAGDEIVRLLPRHRRRRRRRRRRRLEGRARARVRRHRDSTRARAAEL